MKKIYAQKKIFLFMNFFSLFFCVVGLFGGFTMDKSMFYLLIVSCGLTCLSLLFLINKLYYNEHEIKFSAIYNKVTFKYEDIKEIFIQYDLVTGVKIIFNLEKETKEKCCSYIEYTKILKRENIKNTISFIGASYKEIKNILDHCQCPKIVSN